MDLKKLFLMGIATVALSACGGGDKDSADTSTEAKSEAIPSAPTMVAVSEEQMRSYIKTLASDEFQGRAPATAGGQMTVEWLEARMKEMGLKPGNGDSYRQEVPLVELTLDPAQSNLVINTPDGGSNALPYREEAVYWTKRVEEDISFENSEMVFVGYGVVAPEYGWNDYADIDVTGKTVVMLVNDPGYKTGDENLFNGNAMTYYGRWTYKYEEAARQGAAAAIVIHQTAPAAYGWGVVEGSWSGAQLDLERPDGGASRAAMEGWIQESTAQRLFDAAGLDFEQLQQDALTNEFKAVPMGGLTASGMIKNSIKRSSSANVAGYVEGTEHPDEFVLYMAHWDHLGVGTAPAGTDASEMDLISNGAVDNATGTAAIISIGGALAQAEVQPKRSVMIVAVTAEESGLLGSAYYAEDPLVPLNKTVGGINIDAMPPTGLSKDIVVVGYGASELEDILKEAADKRGMYLRPDPEAEKGYFYRSDHISLAKKGVPMLYADSGPDLVEGGEEAGAAYGADYRENRYHKPGDEYQDDWNMESIMNTVSILQEVGMVMAYSDIQPNWYEGNEFRALRDAQMAE